MKSVMDDVFMLGVEGSTYENLLEIAKKQNKSVTQVAAEALHDKISKEKTVIESRERKVLCEG